MGTVSTQRVAVMSPSRLNPQAGAMVPAEDRVTKYPVGTMEPLGATQVIGTEPLLRTGASTAVGAWRVPVTALPAPDPTDTQ